jgi:hypothetical protein
MTAGFLSRAARSVATILRRIANWLHESDAEKRWREMWAKEFHRKELL